MPKKSRRALLSSKFKEGDIILLDGAEYEVIDYGDISWEGVLYQDSYALWCNEDDYLEVGGHGRIETRKYVEENAK